MAMTQTKRLQTIIESIYDVHLMSSMDKEGMYASRRDANGSIDSINLNLTEAQWLVLDSACKGGTAKLVIAYEASSMKEEGQ